MILQLNSEPLVKELDLLCISIHMVTHVLCKIVELLNVLIDRTVSLLQIQKLCKLATHCARCQVMATKSDAELTPWHMVICWKCGCV
jgi:hypothetical protein